MRRQAGFPARTIVLFTLLLLLGSSGTAWAVTVGEIENQLMCTCGCPDPSLAACTCEVANTMREEITGQIDDGKNESEIIAFMRGKYGNEITNAPDKSGFDLTAWLMPFAVVFAGSVGIVKVMSTWVKKSKGKGDDDHTDDGPGVTADDRVENELKDFGW